MSGIAYPRCRALLGLILTLALNAQPAAIGDVVDRVADRLLATQQTDGSWPNEPLFTGAMVSGLAAAYEACGDSSYRTAAEHGGDYILAQAHGNYLGDEAYALACLSRISDDPENNPWRTALSAFYQNIREAQGGTWGYILEYSANSEPSTAVFYIAHHNMAAHYVGALDRQTWRQALKAFLSVVDDSAWYPVMAMGVATWSLAETGSMDQTYIDPSGYGTPYWSGVTLDELPGLLLGHQIPAGQPYAGGFFYRFDHRADGADFSGGYTEDSTFGTLGLMAGFDADLNPEAGAAIQLARQALGGGVDAQGVVYEHLSQQGVDYYVFAGELLYVLSELTEPVSNRPPVTVDDAYSVDVNGILQVGAPGVLGNDEDPEGHLLLVTPVTDVNHGVLTFYSDGSFQYEPESGFSGSDQFTYEATDNGEPPQSDTATVTLLVGWTLMISSGQGGVVLTPGEGSYTFAHGVQVPISAAANPNYHFVSWVGTAVDEGKVAEPAQAVTTVFMDAGYTLEATFARDLRTLSISSGPGGSVTSPGEGDWQFAHGETVPLTAQGEPNHHFVSWTGTAVDTGRVSNPASATTSVSVDGDYTLHAEFAADTRTLTISSTAGGHVVVPGEGSHLVVIGSEVTVTAQAQANYHFTEWTGTAVDAGQVADPTSATTTVRVDADYTLQASFVPNPKTLVLSSSGGGSVASPGEGSYTYDHGDEVSIIAQADSGFQFLQWTGTAVDAGKVAGPASASTTVIADANYTIHANFGRVPCPITISSTSGGSVVAPGEGYLLYECGTLLSVAAAPDLNHHFVSWIGTAVDNGRVTNPASPNTTVEIDAGYTLQAVFAIDQHVLIISSTDGGSVTVPGEGSYFSNHAALVEVTAEPLPGYQFLGWAGTAADAGYVINVNSASTVVIVYADYTLEACFGQLQRTLTVSASMGGQVVEPGQGAHPYDDGAVVPIVAVANENWYFVDWTGTAVQANKVADPQAKDTTVTMDADYTLHANFASVLSVLHVDDDATFDGGPNDPAVSDPCENGSVEHPFDTIREAIDIASDGMTVIVHPGLYTENLNLLGKSIIARSLDPNDPNVVAGTILDGNYLDTVVTFDSSEDPNCVLSGLTLINGNAQTGGGICCIGSSPTMDRCVLMNNNANLGGGVYNSDSRPVLIGCELRANDATSDGGGIYNLNSDPCVTRCILSGNTAGGNGGAISNQQSNPDIRNCLFSGNSSSIGSGVYNYQSVPEIVNCTFSDNVAGRYPASTVYCSASAARITNCIIWANTGGGIVEIGKDPQITYCDVQGGWPGIGNINVDPLLFSAGHWDNNGTPTIAGDDFWVDGDYHLTADSPCIDVGDPLFSAGPNELDIDTDPRIIGGRVDMGADEYRPLEFGDLNGDGECDLNDWAVFSMRWLNQDCVSSTWCQGADIDHDGMVDFLDFAHLVGLWIAGY